MKKIVSLFLSAILCAMLVGCANNNTSESSYTSEEVDAALEAIYEEKANSEPEEHNTSEYVDYLDFKARKDAKNATDTELQAALDWIKDNQDSYFDNNEQMELTMYYGSLLKHKNKSTDNQYEKIGRQAFNTVKYVYRGAESESDDATVQNYEELKELLSNVDDIARE